MDLEVRILIGLERSQMMIRAVKSNNSQVAMTGQDTSLWTKVQVNIGREWFARKITTADCGIGKSIT